MSPKTETAIGTGLAVLGGGVFAGMIYYLLAVLLNFPIALAIGLAVIVGGLQYFIFRFIFLTIGGNKGHESDP